MSDLVHMEPILSIDIERLPKVITLPDPFYLPDCTDPRRVNVLLPYDYDNTDKRYPVLYLNDGQNLFGEGSPYGNWEIDKRMAMLAERNHHEVILVSIDHGEAERIREYTLYKTKAGPGKGRSYLEAVARQLKPYIDSQFRTLPDPGNTGIGGSSLSGLISIYAGLMFPDVFGRLMIFSPSLWISPKIYFDAIRFQAPVPIKIYVYGGAAESTYMVPNIQRFKEALMKQRPNGPAIDLHLSIAPVGTHQEAHWGREFPQAVEWLFYGN